MGKTTELNFITHPPPGMAECQHDLVLFWSLQHHEDDCAGAEVGKEEHNVCEQTAQRVDRIAMKSAFECHSWG
ncbi:hypothetical protein RRG08_022310 [Elysia crispata]|uniref:Uncharacterized protein n=1 Tax=Elysia crispata TaxID=231223 RepID=A0AAE0ZRC4_9GAST|nr:hypothetical protein RRG08_022310 [Elysia crispata]